MRGIDDECCSDLITRSDDTLFKTDLNALTENLTDGKESSWELRDIVDILDGDAVGASGSWAVDFQSAGAAGGDLTINTSNSV